jgi:hypothetical protein
VQFFQAWAVPATVMEKNGYLKCHCHFFDGKADR